MRYSDTADVLSWDDEEDMDVRSVGSSGRSPVRRFVALANGLQDGQVVLGSAHWIAVVYDVEPRQLRVGGDTATVSARESTCNVRSCNVRSCNVPDDGTSSRESTCNRFLLSESIEISINVVAFSYTYDLRTCETMVKRVTRRRWAPLNQFG